MDGSLPSLVLSEPSVKVGNLSVYFDFEIGKVTWRSGFLGVCGELEVESPDGGWGLSGLLGYVGG